MKLSKPNQVVVQLNLKIHRNLNKGDKKFVGYPFIVYRLNSDFVDHIERWLTQIKKKKKKQQQIFVEEVDLLQQISPQQY